jgi:hypothetical protein
VLFSIYLIVEYSIYVFSFETNDSFEEPIPSLSQLHDLCHTGASKYSTVVRSSP